MKQILLLMAAACTVLLASCEKDKDLKPASSYGNGPKTEVPAALRGNWMYGHFSMTEYWSENPATYLGNAFEMAIAFHFNSDGTYEQYFTSRTVSGTQTTYHQSVSKGTVEIDEAAKTIRTHAATAHYKQTQNGQTKEDRDLNQDEITRLTNYTYEYGTAASGDPVLYLTMEGTSGPLTFVKQP